MSFKSSQGFKMLKSGDRDFTFSPNGVTLVPRASLEISPNCPSEYKQIITQAYRNGWLKPVANIRNTEYLMELLKDEYAS
jgi:hypothetical protein